MVGYALYTFSITKKNSNLQQKELHTSLSDKHNALANRKCADPPQTTLTNKQQGHRYGN